MVDTTDEKHKKILESLENLSKRVFTLSAGKFTGSITYELNVQNGTFMHDHFSSRGRMTPAKKPEE